jgi:predicted RNA-binding Zn-ribbon protein involved in translation (DUF1610 family)
LQPGGAFLRNGDRKMRKTNITKHVHLPKDTPAFFCGNCGAVSLDANGICNPQGKVLRGDWCGSKSSRKAEFCHNAVHNERFNCHKCGKVAVNKALLCEPEEMIKNMP